MTYEQGPIRPPSEASSLLVRVSRNCPWNRCAFCSVYKGRKFSLRTVEEVLNDLDAMRELYGDRAETVFLQDANPVLTRPDELIQIIHGIRKRFSRVRRITAYARSHTLARRSPEELERLREAGLDRIHVGMESGSDQVLKLVDKGTTRTEQIEAGKRVKSADFELSEYIMPGLGGRGLSEVHAVDSGSALVEIQPDFVRLRTTAVIPGTPLAELVSTGQMEPLGEIETVVEIRRFLTGLEGLKANLVSDHMLNLLMELEGELPRDLDRLIATCDRLIGMPQRRQHYFILARRLNWVSSLQAFEQLADEKELEAILVKLESEGGDPENLSHSLRIRMI